MRCMLAGMSVWAMGAWPAFTCAQAIDAPAPAESATAAAVTAIAESAPPPGAAEPAAAPEFTTSAPATRAPESVEEREPVVSIDYLRSLEQARAVTRETIPSGGSYPPYRPRAPKSAFGPAGSPPFGFHVLQVDANNRFGVRVDADPALGLRPYVGADVEASRSSDGWLPVPVIGYGALLPADGDTSVSAGVRQPQPLPGAAGDPGPRTFHLELDRRF